MEVLSIEEKNDGSAELNMKVNKEELQFLINFAINRILEEQLEKMKNEEEDKEASRLSAEAWNFDPR